MRSTDMTRAIRADYYFGEELGRDYFIMPKVSWFSSRMRPSLRCLMTMDLCRASGFATAWRSAPVTRSG